MGDQLLDQSPTLAQAHPNVNQNELNSQMECQSNSRHLNSFQANKLYQEEEEKHFADFDEENEIMADDAEME